MVSGPVGNIARIDLFERLDNDFNFRHVEFEIPPRCRKLDIFASSEPQTRGLEHSWQLKPWE